MSNGTLRERAKRILPWAIAVAVIAVVAGPTAAFAATPPELAGVATAPMAASTAAPGYMQYVPLYRWTTAIGTLHWQGGYDFSGMFASISRGAIQPMIMTAATAMWVAAAWLINLAMGFEIMNTLGEPIDQFAKIIAEFVTDSPIAWIAVAVAAFVAFRNAARGGGMRALLRIVSVSGMIALLVLMATGATNSTTATSADGQKVYQPGIGSPGWVVVNTNDLITKSTAGLATLIDIDKGVNALTYPSDGEAGNTLHCAPYMEQLRTQAAGSSEGSAATERRVTALFSTFWESNAIPAYKAIQFGADNPYADKVFCMSLEQGAKVSLNQVRAIYSQVDGDDRAIETFPREAVNVKDNGWMFWTPDNESNWQANYVAFAACDTADAGGSWQANPAWAKVYGKKTWPVDGDPNTLCETWWNTQASGETTDIPDEFDVEPGDSGVSRVLTGEGSGSQEAGIRDYLSALTGTAGSIGGGWVVALSYGISSLVILIVFGTLALGTVLAKIVAAFFGLMLIITIFGALFRKDGWGQIGGAFFRLLGAQIFASATVLVLTLMVQLSMMIASLGPALAGSSSFVGLIWTGLSPVLTVMGLSYLFKVFKLPSPLSIKGGQAWANSMAPAGQALMGGAIGGMIGSGAGGPDAAMDKAGTLANQGSTKLQNAVGGKGTGNVSGRGQGGMLSGTEGAESPTGAGVGGLGRKVVGGDDQVEGDSEANASAELSALERQLASGNAKEARQARAQIGRLGDVTVGADGKAALGASAAAGGIGGLVGGMIGSAGGGANGTGSGIKGLAAGTVKGAKEKSAAIASGGVNRAAGALKSLNSDASKVGVGAALMARKDMAFMALEQRGAGARAATRRGASALGYGVKGASKAAISGSTYKNAAAATGRGIKAGGTAAGRAAASKWKNTLGSEQARAKMIDSAAAGAKRLPGHMAKAGKVAGRGALKTTVTAAKIGGAVVAAGVVTAAVAGSKGKLAPAVMAGGAVLATKHRANNQRATAQKNAKAAEALAERQNAIQQAKSERAEAAKSEKSQSHESKVGKSGRRQSRSPKSRPDSGDPKPAGDSHANSFTAPVIGGGGRRRTPPPPAAPPV